MQRVCLGNNDSLHQNRIFILQVPLKIITLIFYKIFNRWFYNVWSDNILPTCKNQKIIFCIGVGVMNNQIYDNLKLQKLFDVCKLNGKWKRVDTSIPRTYVALEDNASIDLSIIRANFTESYVFKKNSRIIVKDSIAEFYEEDLIR